MESGDAADNVSLAKKVCFRMQSEERLVRKNAYIELETFLTEKANEFSEQDYRNLFNEIHMYFLNGFRDETCSVRCQCTHFTSFFVIDTLPINDYYLTYLFPVLVERLGSPEQVEKFEDVREVMADLLQAIILKYSKTEQLKPFLNDCVTILRELLNDPYNVIVQKVCKTVINLAEALPRDFHMQAEALINPLLKNVSDRHFKVRLIAIEAIGEVILHSSYKGLEEVLGPLAQRLFDTIPTVRMAIAQVAARWMLEYKDRYSFFHKILPLLLTGLNDEGKETREQAAALWDKVGLQFQQENQKDLKDQLDYLTTPPKFYPEGISRPNLGCRLLVQRNIGKIAPALAKELMSWQEDVRFRCSQLLCSVSLLAEDGITMHLQDLLPTMYSVCRDDDVRVVANIRRASEIIATFVPYEAWSKLVLNVLEDDNAHYGVLAVLAGLIKGAPQENISKHLEEISKVLALDYVCRCRKKQYQLEMKKCVEVICEKYDSSIGGETGYNLFKISVTLLALDGEEISPTIFESLATNLGMGSASRLWIEHTGDLIKHSNKDPKSWTKVTDDCLIFLTILAECKEAFGLNLDAILEVLVKALDVEADAEQKLKTFYVLADVFEEKDVIFRKAADPTSFLEQLVTDVFVPALVWRAGATAEAIRTMASSCLKNAISPIGTNTDLFQSGEVMRRVLDRLLPLLLSLVEDASFRSRQLGMECLALLKQNAEKKSVWSMEDLVKTYPEILKRLDDPTEKVRMCALSVLPVLLENVPDGFKEVTYRAHHELVVDTLLTHFDDDDENVQDKVYDALLTVAQINPGELSRKIEKHKEVLRNKKGCDKVVEYLQQLRL